MLVHFGVIPYLVFDGDYLPSKSITEVGRASKREESRKLGLELHRLGKISQSQNEFQKAVDVTPEMARQLIEELKTHGVQYIVAPYEADAQLAYLERKGIITGILSEDSDLLVFGAKCLLTKLDQYGDCIEINRDDFTACRDISLVGWSDSEFRLMAILSGCDYLANIDKMGLKTAYRLIRKYKDIDKILRMLAFDGKYHVPPDYLESFRKAELTFLHQRVFCPVLNDMVMMTGLGTRPEPEDFAFIGGRVTQDVAVGVACGDLHPMTKQPILVQGNFRRALKTTTNCSQTQSSVKIDDLKGNQSIESFFKARRTPLAELDPNSFKPSASQQRLLQRSNTTWLPEIAPNRTRLAQSGVPRDKVAATSSSTNRETNASRRDQSQLIAKSAKRRRLCLEVEGEGDNLEISASQVTESSPFFKYFPDPSSSFKSKPSTKRGKVAEINIWSDDSIEDVMAGLPDLSECHGQVKKGNLKIFRDEMPKAKAKANSHSEATSDDISARVDSQSSTSSTATKESDTSISTSITDFSKPSHSAPPSQNDDVSAQIPSLGNFSYKPEPGDSLPRRSHHTESKSQTTTSLSDVITRPNLDKRRSMTPLQRLGAKALNRSRSCIYPATSTDAVVSSSSSTHASITKASEHSKPTPETTLVTAEPSTSRIRGSEDQIIPDSEDDDEDEDEDEDPCADADVNPHADDVSRPKPKSRHDFGRFAFMP